MKAIHPRIPVFAIIMFIFLLFVNTLSAQSVTGSVSGTVQDSSNKQSMALATVTVFNAKDTSIVTYRMSDEKGNFRVPGLPLNTGLRILISFSGYDVYRKEFLLSSHGESLNLGTIKLQTSSKEIEEIVVYAERPPITIRGDTIEFNASAFKTLPSTLVEDLLKKLPGMTVDMDGNITVKGRTVNRLLVDGKEFFGGDIRVATRNLPANIVDKVHVMDDKEQLERDPNINHLVLGQVVNLKLKKGVKQGWFGKAYTGAGTNDKHEAGLVMNAFRDTTQLSILMYSNNVNKPGFTMTDLQSLGGFERGEIGGQAITSSQGGIQVNGVSLGGIGQGDLRSLGGGANFNQEFGKKLTVNLQYFYGKVKSDFETLSNRETLFGDTVQTTRNTINEERKDQNHRIGGAAIWRLNKSTSVTFRPEYIFGRNNSKRFGIANVNDNFKGILNDETNLLTGNITRNSYAHSLLVSKQFKKRGRSLTISNNLNTNANNSDDYYNILNNYYYGLPFTIISDELRNRNVDEYTNSLTTSFNDAISTTTSYRISYTAEQVKYNNQFNPFSKSNGGSYVNIIDSIQSAVDRDQFRNIVSAGLTWRKKKLTITPGINYNAVGFSDKFLKVENKRKNYSYLYPTFNIRWKEYGLSYGNSITIPTPLNMQPVPDNTNRQFIVIGNPDLQPIYATNLSLSYYKFKPGGNAISVQIAGQTRMDGVIRDIVIDSLGIQTSRPVNVDGFKSINMILNYTKQIKMNKTRLSLNPSMFLAYNRNIVSLNHVRSNSDNRFLRFTLNSMLNIQDKVEINNRYNINYNNSQFVSRYFRDLDLSTQTDEFEVIVRYPKKIVWESLVNYVHNSNVPTGIKKDVILWNAAINFIFLKDDKGQLRLSAFDLLDKNLNINRNIQENSIYDVQTSSLRRYLMATFIYNIRTTSKKVGGKDRLFLF